MEAGSHRLPLAISGILAEPMALLDAISAAGATVVADDLAGTGRRCYAPGQGDDPLLRLAGTMLSAPPCSTRADSVDARVQHLLGLVHSRGAKAVVFYTVKFCEPELFYLPLLRKALDAAGVPSVQIEVDLAEQLPHQAITRLEALVETMQ
jgi:benzoyl-CoA reductase/2-hydroxyglutaryl-CoA dehydratase subunit BcrC/BadD/HgdB